MGIFHDKDVGQYTVADLMFWVGVFAGLIGAYFLLDPWEVPTIFRLIGGGLAGACLGWGLEWAYNRIRRPPRRPPDAW